MSKDSIYLQFASDNYAGICPEALEYLNKANDGFDYPYGDDRWTKEACDMFRDMFETDCEVFFVYNGTSSNALALSSICQSYHSIISHELAHIETDECGAVEFFSNGAKLLLGKGDNGKLSPESINEIITRRTDIHYAKPQALSITQSTEVGTVYSIDEILNLYKISKRYNLHFHMDGARLANAIAAKKVTPKEITWQCGIDVLCFGGVKNGLMFGETVIFFNKALAEEFAYRCKQGGQLSSKMRFIAAQWIGLMKNKIWLKNAQNANDCAHELYSELKKTQGLNILFPSEANAVFVQLSEKTITALRNKGWHFYTFIGAGGARFMCSWKTTHEAVAKLVADIKDSLK
jgi:threonine aldolase